MATRRRFVDIICILFTFLKFTDASVLNAVCWIQVNDVHGFYGIPSRVTTLHECQTACIKNSACVAIDWEPSNIQKSCWILRLPNIKKTTQNGAITHYQLNHRPSPSSNTVCWTRQNGTHGFGGIPLSFPTLDGCQNDCTSRHTCVAIDWEPSNSRKSCWILKSTETGDVQQTGIITHYERNRPSPNLDTECWISRTDVHGFGGIPHSYPSLAKCQTACMTYNGCVAIDWEPRNPQRNYCWILKSNSDIRDATQVGVITHYQLSRRCQGTCLVRNETACHQRVDALDAQVTSLSSRVDALLRQTSQSQVGDSRPQVDQSAVTASGSSVRRCRLCFRETEGSDQCLGSRRSCSGWSTAPNWTEPFRDDTDSRRGGCVYQWRVECV